jgi:hypothetical protein
VKRLGTAALTLLCACSVILGPDAPTDAQSLYDDLWRQFDRHYSYFEHKNIDWKAQGDAFRPAANATSTQLFTQLSALLNVLNDPHVALRAPTGTAQSGAARAGRSTWYSQALALSMVSQLRVSPSGQMRFGTLSPSIGYVRIASFGGFGWGAEISDAIAQMAGIDALVIDVRNNGGGNNNNSMDIADRFTDARRVVGYYRYRSGPGHSDFTPARPIEIAPAGVRFAGPVAVLCNRRCASATEDFLLRMRAIPGVQLIGDTSMGAVGNPLQRELANGWGYQFSEWMTLTPEMEQVEDAGIAPDIVVPGTAADSTSNVDRALQRAISEINARLSASAVRRSLSPP